MYCMCKSFSYLEVAKVHILRACVMFIVCAPVILIILLIWNTFGQIGESMRGLHDSFSTFDVVSL